TKQFYHCFGCGAHGTAITFLMEHAGLSFVDAVKDLAGMYGMKVPDDRSSPESAERARQDKDQRTRLIETLERANAFYRLQLKASPRAIDYLKGRGLTGQIAARFGLGYAPAEWRGLAAAFARYDAQELVDSGLVVLKDAADGSTDRPADDDDARLATAAAARRYDRLRDRITFPIRNTRGEIIGFGGRVLDRGEPKYLNSPETPVFHKGEELYGLFEARQAIRERAHVIVVEGYMDVVALAQHGFAHAVATLGTACTPMHVQKLFRHTDAVVFSFDGDAAGRRAARRALEAALPHASDTRNVRFLFLPAEHDPDSYVRDLGADAFERAVSNATPLSTFFMQTVAEGCALGTAEGRSQAVANAKPLLTQLPDGALRLQLLQALAELAQLDVRDLKRLVYGKAPSAGPALHAPRRSGPLRRAALTPHERAVVSVLACPAVWPTLEPLQRRLLSEGDSAAAQLAAWFAALLDSGSPSP
ncbi:MAG: toprim domain-containing protein, partial [Betaproteobacteria bacterium]|nr:toprim domain-containing protein [Betaproteobacteria bacterium]